MKKNIFKIVTAALAAVLAINSFSINSKPASAEEIDSIKTVETENSYGKLIYEHENEDGLIERVYLEDTPDSYSTQSSNLTFRFILYDAITSKEIAENYMYTAWVYDGAVPTYPNLAYYTNNPIAKNGASITYLTSHTIQGKEVGVELYRTEYQADFSCTYLGHSFEWYCYVTFYSNGTFRTNGTLIKS